MAEEAPAVEPTYDATVVAAPSPVDDLHRNLIVFFVPREWDEAALKFVPLARYTASARQERAFVRSKAQHSRRVSMSTGKTVLYSAPNSRGAMVEWYIRSIKAPVEVVNLDMGKGEHKSPEFLRVNPFGKVPALEETGPEPWSLNESGAILYYLAEKYDRNFPKDAHQRAQILQWILFANATLAQTAFMESLREKQLPGLLAALDQHFSKHTFAVGETFTVADVALGSYLGYIPMFFPGKVDMTPYSHLNAYMERVKERQAAASA